MPERQKHGFAYQKYIVEKYNIIEDEKYTAEWDGFFNKIPVSIKVQKKGTDIELADYFRNASKTEDFYLFVGFWENEKENIVEEYILFIPYQEYNLLFNQEFFSKFKSLLENISNSKEDDAKWSKEIKKLKKEWKEKTPNLIRPRFKRDHKKQKRIQCAINNKDFFNHFLKRYEVKLNERND
jgi:hypothetical protein